MAHPRPADESARCASSPSPSSGSFVLVSCQPGAEAALTARQEAMLPGARRAAWRRGVVTFRMPATFDPPDDYFPEIVFARSVIRSLGQIADSDPAACGAAVRRLVGGVRFDAVHVWPRDVRFMAAAVELRAAVTLACAVATTENVARPGDLVLDCVVDEPGRLWVGWHRARTPASTWPGGIYPVGLPAHAVSRAWLKLDEAITVFGVDLIRGQRAIELGAAPGGACQRLLESGLKVVGVDPAPVDSTVAAHPRFTQWRMRARDVPVRHLRGFDWLVADMNIDPSSTMEAVGRAVTARGTGFRGVIATLKLPAWSRAVELDAWLDRFRQWGYEPVARQLSTAGRELSVYACRPAVPRVNSPRRRATRRRDG